MELKIEDRKFVCIDYPGIVHNVDKMLDTLGGEKGLNKVCNDTHKRIELRFRPDDIYCKPAWGDRQAASSLVLKVRRRKKNQPPNVEQGREGTGSPSEELEGEILGIVDTMFSFNTMADFQYLPMKTTNDGHYESIRSDLVLDRLLPRTWLTEPAPLFLPPPIFSRIDIPVMYCFRDPPVRANQSLSTDIPPNYIGVARSRRPHFTVFLKYTDSNCPTAPYPQALEKLSRSVIDSSKVAAIKEMFEIQPVWTSSALMGMSKIKVGKEDFKLVLPTVAYYCQDGPWRAMWVKFGFDPRKDAVAKIYQNLDFRFSRADSMCSVVPAKRSTFDYNLPNTISRSHVNTSVINPPLFDPLSESSLLSTSSATSSSGYKTSVDSAYIFRPGVAPPHRQVFYHLCHIVEPEVQRLVHLNDGQEKECSEKDGWCLPDTIDKCRQVINAYFKVDRISSSHLKKRAPYKYKPPEPTAASATIPEVFKNLSLDNVDLQNEAENDAEARNEVEDDEDADLQNEMEEEPSSESEDDDLTFGNSALNGFDSDDEPEDETIS